MERSVLTKRKIVLINILVMVLIFSFYLLKYNSSKVTNIEFGNKIELDTEWSLNLAEKIKFSTIYDDKLYVMTESNNIVIYNDIGKKIHCFDLKSDIDPELTYSMYVFEDWIALYREDEIVLVDRSLQQEIKTLNIARNSFGIYVYEDLLFYTDSDRSTVVALNVRDGKVVWELYDGDARRFEVYGNKERLFAEDFNNNEVFEVDLEKLEIKQVFESMIIKKVSDGKSNYYLWRLQGVDDDEVVDEYNKRISSRLKEVNDSYYSMDGDLITIYDKRFKIQNKVLYPVETYLSLTYNNNIVFSSRGNPVTIFDPLTCEIIWTSKHIASWSGMMKWDDSLLLYYTDGYIEKLKEK